jgi:hypothetical protein
MSRIISNIGTSGLKHYVTLKSQDQKYSLNIFHAVGKDIILEINNDEFHFPFIAHLPLDSIEKIYDYLRRYLKWSLH